MIGEMLEIQEVFIFFIYNQLCLLITSLDIKLIVLNFFYYVSS